MKPVRLLIAGLALGALSQAAVAFQETGGKAMSTGSQGPTGQASGPAAAVATSDASSGKGMEIRIPGLGAIGSLPKLDFGLELLYGASGSARPAEGRSIHEETKPDGNVQIRGTVKYRFPTN